MSDSRKGKRRKRSAGPRTEGGSKHARKTAMVVLEVLGGLRSPTQAAEALGVSTTRYYNLESQALEGLVAALEPRARGPRKRPETQIAKLEARIAELEKELGRRAALVRLSQRALGVAATKRPAKPAPGKRRRKRPTVRALKAAAMLDSGDDAGDPGES